MYPAAVHLEIQVSRWGSAPLPDYVLRFPEGTPASISKMVPASLCVEI